MSGLLIVGDRGQVQIDGETPLLSNVFYGKSSLTGQSPLHRTASFNSPVPPAIFTRRRAPLSLSKNGDLYRVTTAWEDDVFAFAPILETTSQFEDPRMGLQLFDANGRQIFNTNYRPLNIVRVYHFPSFPVGGSFPAPVNTDLDPSRVYAFHFSTQGIGKWPIEGTGSYAFYTVMASLSYGSRMPLTLRWSHFLSRQVFTIAFAYNPPDTVPATTVTVADVSEIYWGR